MANPAWSETEVEATNREVLELERQIESTRAALAAAERARREASRDCNDATVAQRNTECRRLQDSLDLLSERLAPLHAKQEQSYRAMEAERRQRANQRIQQARREAEGRLSSISARRIDAERLAAALRAEEQTLQSRLSVLRSRDAGAELKGIALEAEQVVREYERAGQIADDRESIVLRDGRVGKYVGTTGAGIVVEVSPGMRVTVSRDEIGQPVAM
jgi:hypothetical protein